MFVSDATVNQNEYEGIMSAKYPKMIPGNLYVIKSSNNCMRVTQNHESGTMYFDKDSNNETNKNIGILVKFIGFDCQYGFEFAELTYCARTCEFIKSSSKFCISEAEFVTLKVEDVTNGSEISGFDTFYHDKVMLNRTVDETKSMISTMGIVLFAIAVTIGMLVVLSFLPSKANYVAICAFVLCLIFGIGSTSISRLIYRKEIKNMRNTRKHNNHQYLVFIANRSVIPKFYYYSDEYRSVFCDKKDQEFYTNKRYYIYDDAESCTNTIHDSVYAIL